MSSAPAPELAPVREDAWLSGLLGRPAWRVGAEADDAAATAAVNALEGPCFCDARVECANVERVKALEAAGMHVVSTSLGLTLRPGETLVPPAGITVRSANPERDGVVGSIAERCFNASRFHLDPDFPDEVARRSKREWAENGLAGRRGTGMLVAFADETLVGFLVIVDSNVIDLIGVDSAAQGRGVGTALVAALIDSAPTTPIKVGTQAANIGATRFYERLGFELETAAYDLHLHRQAG